MPEPTFSGDTICPHCRATQELHTNATGTRPPRDGDVAICWRCRGIAVFANGPFGLVRRKPTPEEETQIVADPRIRRVLAAASSVSTPRRAAGLSREVSDDG